MAVSKQVDVHNLLNAWCEVGLEDIWRFNQVVGNGAPSSECAVYIQNDREIIARALNQAWTKFVTYLNYFPRPAWFDEVIPLRKGVPWQRQMLRTRYGYVEAFGQRATSVIQAAAAVAYSDADGDGVNDTATITVNTTVDTDEIQLFFQVADGALSEGDIRYQIEPLHFSVSGGTVTITGHRALFVKPSTIWDVPYSPASVSKITRNDAQTNDPADFVTAVDVYRVYNDTTTPLQVVADPIWTQSTGLDSNILTTGTARLIDPQMGTFMPRLENCDCADFIESVHVYYKSGYPLQFDDMDYQLKEGIVRLANTLMPRELCTFCQQTRFIWEEDRKNGEAVEELANNPFGIKRGQMFAWQVVADRALSRTAQL